MYKIYRLETETLYDDLFESQAEAVQMARYFIDDDTESITEPDYSYGIVDEQNNMKAVLRNSVYIDLKNVNCTI